MLTTSNRHVRVHHIDKDKDDEQLRDDLSQRPEGRPSRGRRRRRTSLPENMVGVPDSMPIQKLQSGESPRKPASAPQPLILYSGSRRLSQLSSEDITKDTDSISPPNEWPVVDAIDRPSSVSADTGTYIYMYHGCKLKFDMPAKLQRHKRDGQHDSASIPGESGSGGGVTREAVLPKLRSLPSPPSSPANIHPSATKHLDPTIKSKPAVSFPVTFDPSHHSGDELFKWGYQAPDIDVPRPQTLVTDSAYASMEWDQMEKYPKMSTILQPSSQTIKISTFLKT